VYGAGSRGVVVVGRSVPRIIGPSRDVRVVAPVRFYQPYYTFRPRVSLGFGLWVGFPITYPSYYGYYDPYSGRWLMSVYRVADLRDPSEVQ
jgi:hypothetical protein